MSSRNSFVRTVSNMPVNTPSPTLKTPARPISHLSAADRLNTPGLRQRIPTAWEVSIAHDFAAERSLIIPRAGSDIRGPEVSSNAGYVRHPKPAGHLRCVLSHQASGERPVRLSSWSRRSSRTVRYRCCPYPVG